MRTPRRWVRRVLRAAARRVWADARPSTATDLHRRHDAVAPRDGTTPTPSQRFVPTTTATGPWAELDPLYAPAWPSRAAALTAVGFWAVVALRIRRQLAGWTGGGDGADEDVAGRAT